MDIIHKDNGLKSGLQVICGAVVVSLTCTVGWLWNKKVLYYYFNCCEWISQSSFQVTLRRQSWFI